jgi:hypothetical protein
MARWDIFFSTKVLSNDDWNGNLREIFSNYSPTKCYPFFEKVGEWWRFRVGKSSQLGINISWHYPVSTIRPNSFSIVFCDRVAVKMTSRTLKWALKIQVVIL